MIDIHRGVPSVVYCGYDIATVLKNVEGVTDYRIGRARVWWLCICVCVLGEMLCKHSKLHLSEIIAISTAKQNYRTHFQYPGSSQKVDM